MLRRKRKNERLDSFRIGKWQTTTTTKRNVQFACTIHVQVSGNLSFEWEKLCLHFRNQHFNNFEGEKKRRKAKTKKINESKKTTWKHQLEQSENNKSNELFRTDANLNVRYLLTWQRLKQKHISTWNHNKLNALGERWQPKGEAGKGEPYEEARSGEAWSENHQSNNVKRSREIAKGNTQRWRRRGKKTGHEQEGMQRNASAGLSMAFDREARTFIFQRRTRRKHIARNEIPWNMWNISHKKNG